LRQKRVLVVDDDPGVRRGIGVVLSAKGYQVDLAETCSAALECARVRSPDALLLDQQLPDGTGLELMGSLRKIAPGVPAILLTAHGSIELAVQAIKQGAEQFLTKPVDMPALLVLLERALEGQRSRRRQLADGRRVRLAQPDPFIGPSAAIRTLAEECRTVVDTDTTVLIEGETGTGKGVLARWLHENGPRSDEAFVDLNCAGFSRELLESELFGHEAGAFTGAAAAKQGLFEMAHQGSVFLDEIGDLDPQIQPKLLKVLEERSFRRLGDVRDRHVDMRLIAATHQDLDLLTREKKFREDLFFRINAFPLRVPPLRERREDIPALTRTLLDRFAAELGRGPLEITAEAQQALQWHTWPGNVRELRNTLERAVLLSARSTIDVAQLRFGPHAGTAAAALAATTLNLQELERRTIERALLEARWQISDAARLLGISRTTLYKKVSEYGFKAPGSREA
jgi:DNA-binding NtrC family response regulator